MSAPTPADLLAEFCARIAAGIEALPAGEPRPPLTRRQRLARHVGQAGWRLGYTISQLGSLAGRVDHGLGVLGDRVIDAGDWLAGKVAGR